MAMYHTGVSVLDVTGKQFQMVFHSEMVLAHAESDVKLCEQQNYFATLDSSSYRGDGWYRGYSFSVAFCTVFSPLSSAMRFSPPVSFSAFNHDVSFHAVIPSQSRSSSSPPAFLSVDVRRSANLSACPTYPL